MPRFFMAGTNIMGGMAIMTGRDAEHVRVLRLRPGEDTVEGYYFHPYTEAAFAALVESTGCEYLYLDKVDDLFRDGYKSVFIGAGLWKANAMHIKGETLGNVAFGIDYLANSKAFQLGDDIAVIGVGNSAMDCARTAIRNGARHVTCYARRDEECISASEHEVRYAKLEGVGFRFCKAPVWITTRPAPIHRATRQAART